MTTLKVLNDAYPNGFLGDAIFDKFINPPWESSYKASDLNLQFFSKYGQKPITPLLEHFMTDNGISKSDQQRISDLLLDRFRTNWTRKFNILSVDYNPIENYNMVETSKDTNTGTDSDVGGSNETSSNSNTGTVTDNNTESISNVTENTGTVTNENTGSQTGTEQGTTTNNDGVFGFNSTTKVNSSENTGTNNKNVTNTTNEENTQTLATKVEDTNTKTSTNTQTLDTTNSVDKVVSTNNTKTLNLETNHELTRTGNIGVTTSQQMIESEIKLWDWNFIDSVFKDIADILTLPIYEVVL